MIYKDEFSHDRKLDGDEGEDILSINANSSEIEFTTNSVGVTYLTYGNNNLTITDDVNNMYGALNSCRTVEVGLTSSVYSYLSRSSENLII